MKAEEKWWVKSTVSAPKKCPSSLDLTESGYTHGSVLLKEQSVPT